MKVERKGEKREEEKVKVFKREPNGTVQEEMLRTEWWG